MKPIYHALNVNPRGLTPIDSMTKDLTVLTALLASARAFAIPIDLETPPTGIECAAQAIYRHRPDGQPGREIKITYNGGKLYTAAEMEVLTDGQAETVKLPAAPNGTSETTLLLPPNVGVDKNAQVFVTIKSGNWSTRQSFIVSLAKTHSVRKRPRLSLRHLPHDLGHGR